jgi:predicted ArsR family transcriptional regulator
LLSFDIMRRKALDIKKKILEVLKKEKELSLRDLDIKVNTNSKTIQAQIEELEWFGKVKVTKHPKSKTNGRPFTSVKLAFEDK